MFLIKHFKIIGKVYNKCPVISIHVTIPFVLVSTVAFSFQVSRVFSQSEKNHYNS